MSVSMGVLPTRRTKKSCSMTWAETVRREGNRSSSLPKRVGWLGYWLRSYSSRAHCDFSWRLSMWAASDKPQASEEKTSKPIIRIPGKLIINVHLVATDVLLSVLMMFPVFYLGQRGLNSNMPQHQYQIKLIFNEWQCWSKYATEEMRLEQRRI